MIFFSISSPTTHTLYPLVLLQSCCFMSDDPMLLEMSLTVRMENAQQDFVEHRQYLLENLFVVYVAMEKTKTSGKS